MTFVPEALQLLEVLCGGSTEAPIFLKIARGSMRFPVVIPLPVGSEDTLSRETCLVHQRESLFGSHQV